MIGFPTVHRNFLESWDITWMAVPPDHHHRHIGRQLIGALVEDARDNEVRPLQVKTLADLHPSPEHVRTRAFSESFGSLRLEVTPELWGPENPYLLLVMPLRVGCKTDLPL